MVKRLYQYHLPERNREGLILQMEDAWGEIAPLPGFSRETLTEAKQEILDVLRDNKKPKLPSVLFGLSAQPLTPVKVRLSALHHPKPGCTTLKLKLGHLSAIQAVDLVKQYVGKYRLRLDCNRKWSLSEALLFASHFRPTDFEYFEEPVETYSDLVRFSHQTQFPIAVDESLREHSCLDIPTLAAAVIKPTLWGGIPPLPFPSILSSSYESSLGILQIARLGNPETPQGLDTFTPDFLDPPIRIENGYLTWTPSKNPIDTKKLCLLAIAP